VTYPDGWGWPGAARKPHYFRDGMSLCGKWMLFSPSPREGGLEAEIRSDDCTVCARAVVRLRGEVIEILGRKVTVRPNRDDDSVWEAEMESGGIVGGKTKRQAVNAMTAWLKDIDEGKD
jgi:hypothetical protein